MMRAATHLYLPEPDIEEVKDFRTLRLFRVRTNVLEDVGIYAGERITLQVARDWQDLSEAALVAFTLEEDPFTLRLRVFFPPRQLFGRVGPYWTQMVLTPDMTDRADLVAAAPYRQVQARRRFLH